MSEGKILVRLEDLMIPPFYVELNNRYRNLLLNMSLEKANNIKNIAKIVGCHKDTMRNFLQYGKSINVKTLSELLNFLKINIHEAEKYVVSVKRGCSNNEVKIKLPIKATPKLALLLAKSMGDGGISTDFRFHYSNNQPSLINEVIDAVRSCIGSAKYNLQNRVKRKTYELKFCSTMGFILNLMGAPKGPKIEKEFCIPNWIMEGNDKIKSSFLRGIFDDEACVNNSQPRTKRILFAMGKNQSYENSLRYFLNQIRQLLLEFNINSKGIVVQQRYDNKIILKFVIYRKANFKNFKDFVNFNHKEKKIKLSKMIKNYVGKNKTKNLILKTIKDSNSSLTINEVSIRNNIDRNLAKYHMNNLLKECLINKEGNYRALWASNKK